MATTNDCTVTDLELCHDNEEVRNVILRRQPDNETKLEAGGALNYLTEAYRFIENYETMQYGNKQKLTAVVKNKLAIMYMEMRQEADIRNSLCEVYRVTPEEILQMK